MRRLASGGRIDRGQTLRFSFDGQSLTGFAGDTLASALLANDVRVIGKSVERGRPRGIYAAGAEEPNAYLRVRHPDGTLEPLVRATRVQLTDGLQAWSTSGKAALDDGLSEFGAGADAMQPRYDKVYAHCEVLVVGGGPAGLSAALAAGRTGARVLLVDDQPELGGSLLAEAVAGAGDGVCAARAGEGAADGDESSVTRAAALEGWRAATVAELEALSEVTLLPAATAFGIYEANCVMVAQQRRLWQVRAAAVIVATGAHERPLAFADNDRPGIVLATSALTYVNRYSVAPDICLVMTNNDQGHHAALGLAAAGVRVAAVVDLRPDPNPSAAAAAPGTIASANLDPSAADQTDAGAATSDATATARLAAELRQRGVDVLFGHAVIGTEGDPGLTAAHIAPLATAVASTTDPSSATPVLAPLAATGPATGSSPDQPRRRTIRCDLLAVSGGFNPVVHLASHAQARLRFDERAQCFVPESPGEHLLIVGAAAGQFGLGEAISHGQTAGRLAAAGAGFFNSSDPVPAVDDRPTPPRPVPESPAAADRGSPQRARESAPAAVDNPKVSAQPVTETEIAQGRTPTPGQVSSRWLIPSPDGTWTTHFVDLHRDTTVAEIARGLGAGLRSIEHLKRFTTAGTGADQGKTGGVLTAAVAATLLGQPVAALGTTTYRPPYVPVSFALLAGRNRGDLYDPIRVTPIHAWHVARGAVFENVGQWKRPWYYPCDGENMAAAVIRECRAAREGVAVMDASTLGKIDVQGPDAAEFLNRMYTNTYDRLDIGHIRYGVLCRADGMVFDDGVVMRLAADRFLTSTTTGNAAEVLEWMEEWLQTEWPWLRVRLTSVTDHWSTIAIVGPLARDVLRRLAPELDVDNAAFPFMTLRHARVAGAAARVCRVSFSGELAFEVNVPGPRAIEVWQAVMAAGASLGITPYGTEAMHVLRAEKGYIIVGQDTDGTVTPLDLGLGWMVSMRKPDFVGRRSLARTDTARPDRKQLVGLLPLEPSQLLPEGAQLVDAGGDGSSGVRSQGHVTSSYYSAALGRTFALALLRRGRERHGQVVQVPLQDRVVAATVTGSVLYDPGNERRDG
jgi:sarcosine oxidase subunit alpha